MDGLEAQLTVERGGAANYVYGARAARDFGDGFVAVLLPVYLAAIGLGALKIGLVATLALLGSASMTRGIGRLGARLCQRTLLKAASALMVATALAFALSGAYAIVVLAACWPPSIRPRAASAFSCLSSTPPSPAPRQLADRTRMLAPYGLIGAFAAAAGALVTGRPDLLVASVCRALVRCLRYAQIPCHIKPPEVRVRGAQSRLLCSASARS
jgi:MFS family permease